MTQTLFQEVVLKNQSLELAILPQAGCHWPRLRIWRAGAWTDLLYPVPDYSAILSAPSTTGSYVMAPWCNRLPGGILEFEGRRYPLRINFPDNTAIHGDVRKRPWEVLEASPLRFRARLDSASLPDFNYPFPLLFEQAVELRDGALQLEFFIQNRGSVRAPAAFGYHPFFKRRLSAGGAEALLEIPAGKIFPAQDHMPTGPAQPVSERTDYRAGKTLGTPQLDDCFTGFTKKEVRLIYPEDGVEVVFDLGDSFPYCVFYIPSKPDGSGQDFFAVEPQTCVTGALPLAARGWDDTGLKILEPGERWGGTWKIRIRSGKS